MNKYLLLIFAGAVLLSVNHTFAQTTIWSEDFPYPDGTTVGSGTPPKWTINSLPSDDWWEVRSNQMEGKELDDEGVWTTESIDISAYTNIAISMDISEQGNMGNNDYIYAYYRLDGSPTENLIGGYVNDFGSATLTIGDINGSSIVLVVRVRNDNNAHYHRFDNILVQGTLIVDPPVADFTADNLAPDLGQTVTFSDLSTNAPDSWTWSFSPSTVTYVGGTDQNSQNPQVQFNATGLYTVSLTATNGIGSDDEVKADYIDVAFPDILMTNGSITTCEGSFFDSGGPSGNYSSNEDLTFTIFAAIPGNQLELTFNSFNTQTTQDYLRIYNGENITYPMVGQYSGNNSPGVVNSSNAAGALTFVFHSNGGNNQAGWEADIACQAPMVPVADFSASNVTPGIGQTVTFTDLSANIPTSWTWSFSPSTVTYVGGTDQNSQNPQVQFNESGPYTVSLVAANIIGSDNEVKTNYIEVSPASIFMSDGSVVACEGLFYDSGGQSGNYSSNEDFTLTFYPATAGNQIELTFTSFSVQDLFLGFLTDYLEIYNGEDDTAPMIGQYYGTNSPGVVYSSNPAGALTLVFQSDFLITSSGWEAQLACIPPETPVADFTADLTTAGLNQTVSFTDLSTNIPLTWNWSFSPNTVTYVGATSSTSQNPMVEFNATGDYTVTLSVSNSAGSDVEIKTDYIHVDACFISNFPYIEDFNTDGVIPFCWQNIDNSGNGGTWKFDNPQGFTLNSSTSSNGFAVFNSTSEESDQDCDLISPVFDFSSESVVFLQFDHYFVQGILTTAELLISIDGGATWTSVDSWNNSTSNAATEQYDLSALAAGQSAVMFKWNWTNPFFIAFGDWAVDDIIVSNVLPFSGNWTGVVDTDWSNPGNWDDGNVPNAITRVVIPGGLTNYPLVDETANCLAMTINNGAVVTCATGADLAVAGRLVGAGELQMDDGSCSIAGNLTTPSTGTVDVNGGTLSMAGWFETEDFTWASGTVQLSGGVINVEGSAFFYGGTGIMNGPFTMNIGGTLQIESSMFSSVSSGSIYLKGTSGNVNFFLPATATGTAVAWDLIVDAPGSEYVFSRDGDFNGISVLNDFYLQAGTAIFDNLTGMPQVVTVGGDVTVEPGASITANVNSAMNIAGNLDIHSDAGNMASWIDNDKLTVGGTSNVDLYLTPDLWHYTASPVTSAYSEVFEVLYMLWFNESTDEWSDFITAMDLPLEVLTGYAIWAAGSPAQVTFSGDLNSGPATIPVTRNTTQIDQGWNLVGNPYPSYADWDVKSGWSKGPVNNTIYFYSGVSGLSNYQYYQGANGELPGIGVNGGSNEIPPMQGFFVHAAANGNFGINNNARIHGTQPYYKSSMQDNDHHLKFRTFGDSISEATPPASVLKFESEPSQKSTSLVPAIRLEVDMDNKNDETVVRFYQEADPMFEGDFDALKLFAKEYPQIYSIAQGGTRLAINTLPQFDEELKIPVGIRPSANGACALKLTGFDNFEPETNIYLEDLLTDEIHNLSEDPTYYFVASPMDVQDRFMLHFTGEEEIPSDPSDEVRIYSYDQTVFVKLSDHELNGIKITVYNMMGQVVRMVEPGEEGIVEVGMHGSPGNYIVRVQAGNQVFTGKVFIQ